MNVEDFLNNPEKYNLTYDVSKLLQILLAKSILNEKLLYHNLMLLTEINAKLDGKTGNELNNEASLSMRAILEAIVEEQTKAYAAALIDIASNPKPPSSS